MSDTGKQSPLGVNLLGSYLQNIGLCINPVAESYMGISKTNEDYQFGSIVNNTCLNLLTWAIYDAYNNGNVSKIPAGTSVYDNLISISGNGVCAALGNSKPPSYQIVDPRTTLKWSGQATTGYASIDNASPSHRDQNATWIPYLTTNPNSSVTQWGFIRCWALQAWNEFDWNGDPDSDVGMPEYKDFLASFMSASGYISSQNSTINTVKNSQTFLKGTYSNMNDLISADITGVSLATQTFGQDCIAAGKVINLNKIDNFGLPSILLQTIKKYNAMTPSLGVALISAGLSVQDIETILAGSSTAGKLQEQQIYSAFLIIQGEDLENILVPMNCKTKGLESLADLLNIKKLFPNSYQSLTVPVYNTTSSPNNSKTYYPIFEGTGVSSRLQNSTVRAQIGSQVITGEPPIENKPIPSVEISTEVLKSAVTNRLTRTLAGSGDSATGIGSAI